MKKIFLMFAFIVHVVIRSHASAGVANCPTGTGDGAAKMILVTR
ncbi:MAG TPA: hypothetical protein VK174_01905 [Chitinophagales bacterium]|nr:hypothetical protein [Chitinophagales bacterium]